MNFLLGHRAGLLQSKPNRPFDPALAYSPLHATPFPGPLHRPGMTGRLGSFGTVHFSRAAPEFGSFLGGEDVLGPAGVLRGGAE